MSITLLRPAGRSAPVSQLSAVAMWRAQPGALMLLGRCQVPLPKAGMARVEALAGVFRAEFWPIGEANGFAFLAAIRLPQVADRADGAELILCGARSKDRDFGVSVSGSMESADFGQRVAKLAGSHVARVTHFMLDVMRSDDGGDMRQPNAVLTSFFAHSARMDGCVELIMHIPKRCVLLQGWGMRLSEPVDLLLPGTTLLRQPVLFGSFTRTDLSAPATGSVLALPPEAAETVSALDKIYLLTGDDLLCRQVVEGRVLDADASIGQIRHLLPRLDCPPSLHSLLRATLQPQFQGHDTLNSAGRPVRAALDLAIAADRGVYMSGWLFDPAGDVAEVDLCVGDDMVRLDGEWVRVSREDVSAAFRADPAFPPPLAHDWGFAVTSGTVLLTGKPAYLRLAFADGDLAFVPVRFSSAAPSSLRSLLASVDLHKPSALPIVERHLAPFIAIAKQMEPAETSTQILLAGPLDRPYAILAPLRSPKLPRSLVASFLLEPTTADEQIIFVCGPEWSPDQIDALAGLVRFYGLPASIVGSAETPLPANAVLEAAKVSRAGQFLLVSPGVVGDTPGWRHALRQAAGTDQVACPTVLFEDRSIRFAGPNSVTFLDRAPFASVQVPLAGASADLAGMGLPAVVEGGSLSCCLIPAAALPSLVQSARLLSEAGQEAAFFLALRAANARCTWVPGVWVSAPEEEEAIAPVTPLVDGWRLRQTWGEAASCVS